jgi:uncharacterized protein
VNRHLMWTAGQWPGTEHAHVRETGDGFTADGLVVARVDERPIRLHYQLDCDADWLPRRVAVDLYGQRRLDLIRTDGRWHDGDGQERTDLAGCTDVDIAVTPFTNTIPIRRLGLPAGGSADIDVVYLNPGRALEVSRQHQRYTRTSAGYRYESGAFRADLQVDEDGVVTDYPGLWTLAAG